MKFSIQNSKNPFLKNLSYKEIESESGIKISLLDNEATDSLLLFFLMRIKIESNKKYFSKISDFSQNLTVQFLPLRSQSIFRKDLVDINKQIASSKSDVATLYFSHSEIGEFTFFLKIDS